MLNVHLNFANLQQASHPTLEMCSTSRSISQFMRKHKVAVILCVVGSVAIVTMIFLKIRHVRHFDSLTGVLDVEKCFNNRFIRTNSSLTTEQIINPFICWQA